MTALEASLGSLTDKKALSELVDLSTHPSMVTDSTALKIVSLASSFVSSGRSESELTQVAEVLSNSVSVAKYSESGLSIIEAIKRAIDLIVSIAIQSDSDFKLSSSKIAI